MECRRTGAAAGTGQPEFQDGSGILPASQMRRQEGFPAAATFPEMSANAKTDHKNVRQPASILISPQGGAQVISRPPNGGRALVSPPGFPAVTSPAALRTRSSGAGSQFIGPQSTGETNNMMDNNTLMGNVVDRGPWIWYDTITIAAGATSGTSQQPFSVPISGTKTKLQTNMTKGNQLPPPQRFLLRSLGFYFTAGTILADQAQFIANCYCEFRIDQKIYHEGLLQFYPAGIGIAGASTRTDEAAWTIGAPTLLARRDFGKYSRLIGDNQIFTLNIIFPTAITATIADNGGAGINLICLMDGILDRSVQ